MASAILLWLNEPKGSTQTNETGLIKVSIKGSRKKSIDALLVFSLMTLNKHVTTMGVSDGDKNLLKVNKTPSNPEY